MKQTLSDYAYEKLKNEILYGHYPIEGLITEQTIADRYKVSRSPARTALIRLSSEGYLIKYPKKGYIVKNVHGRATYEKRQLRYIIELGIAAHIIQNSSDSQIESLYQYCIEQKNNKEPVSNNRKFHLAVAGLLANPTITQEIQRLMDQSAPKIFDRNQDDEISIQYAKQHKAIVDAMLCRDYNKVAAAINADINMVIMR